MYKQTFTHIQIEKQTSKTRQTVNNAVAVKMAPPNLPYAAAAAAAAASAGRGGGGGGSGGSVPRLGGCGKKK